MLNAFILADSINAENGRRCTTFLLEYPRFIHAELLTHRVFARNSASSRALPVKVMLGQVWRKPAVPVRWGRAKKGMQDGGSLPRSLSMTCRYVWLAARYPALLAAWLLLRLGLHKQVANRLLEPWATMTVVLTGTEWSNFYRLRLHKDAQPEFRALAEVMLRRHAASTPKSLDRGEWHIPFVRDEDRSEWERVGVYGNYDERVFWLLKRATARCARTSYVNFYGRDSVEDDFRLHDSLKQSGHWSPFEHCCRAEAADSFVGHVRGFTPYRKFFAAESRDDGSPFDPAALWAELTGDERQ